MIISKLNHCCEHTAVVNSGILIAKEDVDDHKVTVANPQHGSILKLIVRICIRAEMKCK